MRFSGPPEEMQMKVFISWSGGRSRFIAEALRSWLPRVIQSVKPWMSDEDISAGSRWLSEVSNELSEARVGLICVTPENQMNPWLLFEAGALSKTLEQTYVCPILYDLSPSQMSGPLAQFQANEATFDGIERVLSTLNKALPDNQLPNEALNEILDVWWPKLSARLQEMPPAPEGLPQRRPTDEILEEIVANTREQIRRENIRLEAFHEKESKFDEMMELMRSGTSALQQLQERVERIRDFFTKPTKPEDIARLFKDLPLTDVSQMHKMLNSLKEMSDSSRIINEDLLKAPQKGVTSER
jgi:hypothetical protein